MRKIYVNYVGPTDWRENVRDYLTEAAWTVGCILVAMVFALGLFTLAMYILGHAVLMGGL